MTVSMDRRRVFTGAAAVLSLSAIAAQAIAQTTPTPQAAPARPDVKAFVKSPMIEDCSLSPDGKRIALITRVSAGYMLIVYDVVTKQAQTIGLGEFKIRGVFWGSNDNVIVTMTVTAGLEGYAGRKQEHRLVHNVDLRTGKMRALFDKMDGYHPTVQGDLERVRVDGKYHVTASNYFMDGFSAPLELHLFDLDDGSSERLDSSATDTENWVLTPAGVPVARAIFDRQLKRWQLEFRQPKRGWKKVFEQKEAIDHPSLIGLGRTERSVLIYIDAGEKAGNYYEVSEDGVLSEPLNPQDGSSSACFHPTTRLFCGFARHDDWVAYDYIDPQMKKLAELAGKAMPNYNVKLYEFAAEDPRKVLLYGEANDDPGTYYFIDFASGNYIPVGENYPDLPPHWVTQKQKMQYTAADGLEIHGYLTLPPPPALNGREAKNLPLIVLPHGGPNARDTSAFDWESQLYASRGYAVFQPNFRGSTGYGDAFVEAGYGQWGRKMQTDLSDGVRHLVKAGTVDAKRVCIVGASYGGYAALAGVTLDPGVYNCAVSVAGIGDLKAMLDYDASRSGGQLGTTALYMKRSLGSVKTFDEISPQKHVA
ncbi:MAG: prolyl oligopeptidase family serine peptidase, partial [Asticcacaulis sp.]